MSEQPNPARRQLAAGYRACARLTRAHGTTYFWGAALLPRAQRRHVYAIYALCRLADDIVDLAPPGSSADHIQMRLHRFADSFFTGLDFSSAGAGLEVEPSPHEPGFPHEPGNPNDPGFPHEPDSPHDPGLTGEAAPPTGSNPTPGASANPTMQAIHHTVRELGLPREYFERFFAAMTADLTVTEYQTWDDLCGYMDGSAAVIGEMMLPVLRPGTTREDVDARRAAHESARHLGLAFQLTNFLRDVEEDLDRGRIYLPQEDLDRFDTDPRERRVTPGWRALMAFQIDRNRRLYQVAADGVPHLNPAGQRCVNAARMLYAQILDLIEDADYDIFSGRLRVPTTRKARVAAAQVVRARPHQNWAQSRC
ncbi:MAG: squalene/phytoene synthase family protein [Actinomycetales bacterium]